MAGALGRCLILVLVGAGCAALSKVPAIGSAPPPPTSGPSGIRVPPKSVMKLDVGLLGGKAMYCSSGELLQLKVQASLRDGSTLETWALSDEAREGKLDFANFRWTASAGEVDEEGLYHPPADPLAAVDQEITLTAAVEGNPDVTGAVAVAPIYDCGATARFNGAHGTHGAKGDKGQPGKNGDNAKEGRKAIEGYPGKDGGDGQDGQDGQDGPKVEVALTYIASEKRGRLILARVSLADDSRKEYFLIDPASPSLVVQAAGGDGGSGGRGGDGGMGGYGGNDYSTSGNPGGDGGDGGNGGTGANGGDGGDGGAVVIRYDRAHPELAKVVKVENGGGRGGKRGAAGLAGSPGPGGSSQAGAAGVPGKAGVAGKPGARDGRPGGRGPAARVVAQSARELFSDELARGVKLAD